MTSFLEFVPAITALILATLVGVSLLQFSIVRKNMRIQTEQQIYANILQLRTKIEGSFLQIWQRTVKNTTNDFH